MRRRAWRVLAGVAVAAALPLVGNGVPAGGAAPRCWDPGSGGSGGTGGSGRSRGADGPAVVDAGLGLEAGPLRTVVGFVVAKPCPPPTTTTTEPPTTTTTAPPATTTSTSTTTTVPPTTTTTVPPTTTTTAPPTTTTTKPPPTTTTTKPLPTTTSTTTSTTTTTAPPPPPATTTVPPPLPPAPPPPPPATTTSTSTTTTTSTTAPPPATTTTRPPPSPAQPPPPLAPAPPPPRLVVTTTVSPAQPLPGAIATVRIAVRNAGGGPAPATTLADEVGPTATLRTATAPAGACTVAGRTATCPLGTLAPGDTASAEVRVLVDPEPAARRLSQRITLSATGRSEADEHAVATLVSGGPPAGRELLDLPGPTVKLVAFVGFVLAARGSGPPGRRR